MTEEIESVEIVGRVGSGRGNDGRVQLNGFGRTKMLLKLREETREVIVDTTTEGGESS